MDYNVFLLNIQDKINQEDFFNLKLAYNIIFISLCVIFDTRN
ncbi:hypothetical protein QO066_06950 [Campylobacter coli]